MTLKKTLTIVAAAGALAAVSVPAMALENEFHGLFNFNTTFSNFQDGASGNFSPSALGEKRKMNVYFEQRARLQYIAKASDDLKLVTHFELNNRFGDGGNTDYDTDGTAFVVKHAYLDANLGKTNVKLGMQAYKDTLKGIFVDADVPAIMTTTKLGAYTLGVGFARMDDDGAGTNYNSTPATVGQNTSNLFILDNTFAFTKDTKAAFSYYLLADNAAGGAGGNTAGNGVNLNSGTTPLVLHTFGLSGETKFGPATVSGFLAAQAGYYKPGSNFHGWAANAAAKMPAGPGTAKAAFLFASGNNGTGGSIKGWAPTPVNTYNEGGMSILVRNTGNSPTSTDRYIRREVTNVALLTAGYDYNLSQNVYLNSNVGFGWTPASGETAKGGDFMGAEVNLEAGYKVSPNLTLAATAGYLFLGGTYTDTLVTTTGTGESVTTTYKSPENPYTMRLHAKFSF